MQFRRKKQGKTNYKKRLRLLSSKKHRLVIRRFNHNLSAQIIDYNPKGDKVLIATDGAALKKLGCKSNTGNTPSAYLIGLLAGKKALDAGIKDAIVDIGLNIPVKGSRLFACLKGAVDAGLNIPHSDSILPTEERIKGDHIIKYAETKKTDLKELTKSFEDIKNKIMKE